MNHLNLSRWTKIIFVKKAFLQLLVTRKAIFFLSKSNTNKQKQQLTLYKAFRIPGTALNTLDSFKWFLQQLKRYYHHHFTLRSWGPEKSSNLPMVTQFIDTAKDENLGSLTPESVVFTILLYFYKPAHHNTVTVHRTAGFRIISSNLLSLNWRNWCVSILRKRN